MQQAETADSTASAAASGGKFDKISAKRSAYLSPIPVSEVLIPSNDLSASFSRLRTLLKVMGEVADEASSETGIYYRSPGVWPKERFEHFNDLVNLAIDELARSVSFLDAIDGVVAAHVERKAA